MTDLVHQCESCKKRFRQLEELEAHRVVHANKRVSQCDKCGKCFIQVGGLGRHKKRVHEKEVL